MVNKQMAAICTVSDGAQTADALTQADSNSKQKSSKLLRQTFHFVSKYDIPTSISGFDVPSSDADSQLSGSCYYEQYMPRIHLPFSDTFVDQVASSDGRMGEDTSALDHLHIRTSGLHQSESQRRE